MKAMTVTAGPDGRIEIPGVQPGETVTIHVEPVTPVSDAGPQRSPEEQERIFQQLLEAGKRFRERADPELLNLDHGEWLYGEDGLPK